MKTKVKFLKRTLVDYPSGLTKIFLADSEYMLPTEFVDNLVAQGRIIDLSAAEKQPSRRRRGPRASSVEPAGGTRKRSQRRRDTGSDVGSPDDAPRSRHPYTDPVGGP